MPVITVRVDEELKRAMDRVRDVNWSEAIRERIRDLLEEDRRENRVQALLTLERIKVKASPGHDPTSTIRYWREHRSGRRGR